MSDKYLKFAQSMIGSKICKIIGLPVPPVLQRANERAPVLVDGILIGGINNKPHGVTQPTKASILQILKDQNIYSVGTSLSSYNGVVFDATEIKLSGDLIALYKFFNQHITQLNNCGKIVVIGVNPKQCINSQHATVQRGLIGFIKTIAKEVGRYGITANLIYDNKKSGMELAAPLRYLLSYRSAYVDGQVITLNDNKSSNLISSQQDWITPLEGKVALVTGASRGIGATISRTLARDGAKVIGVDTPQAEKALRDLMSEIGGESIIADISTVNAPEEIANYIFKSTKLIDIIVHNAGITRDKMLAKMSARQWQQVIEVNLTSIERINAILLENELINFNGRIVCVSSISGIAGNLGQSNYATSKSSVIGMIESMAPELAPRNITINAVAPGFIETHMTSSLPLITGLFGRRMCALSQGGMPIDVAETISFLVTPQASGVSGNLIRVCGLSLLGA